MAFSQQPVRTPTSIGTIRIKLFDEDGTQGNMGAQFSIQVLDQNGLELRVLTGDLIPHITVNQRNSLITFLEAIRAQAIDQVL